MDVMRIGRGGRRVAELALLVLAWGSLAAPAMAAPELVSTSPGDGTAIERADEVVLTFTEPVEVPPDAIGIFDSEGHGVAFDEPTHGEQAPEVIRTALPEELPNGQYSVVWRVLVGPEPVSGSFGFEVVGSIDPPEPNASYVEPEVVDEEPSADEAAALELPPTGEPAPVDEPESGDRELAADDAPADGTEPTTEAAPADGAEPATGAAPTADDAAEPTEATQTTTAMGGSDGAADDDDDDDDATQVAAVDTTEADASSAPWIVVALALAALVVIGAGVGRMRVRARSKQ